MPKVKKHKRLKRKLNNNSHGLRDPIANVVTKIWIKSKLQK